MNNNIFIKLKEILERDTFNVNIELKEDQLIKEFPNWDSFKHLAFMIEVENQFGIEITPEDFNSIETIKDLIQKIEQ
ncbi:MAG: acyl carrier protein [Promethearchaeota archaeon]